jgi:DNA mismatch repair protein MSH2
LERLADRYRDIDEEYKRQQAGLVTKAVGTATTYLPVAEAAAAIVAELDVLTSFATAAALAPGEYVRPIVQPTGGGVIKLHEARHPCVELMEGVDFIPNDYDMQRGSSSFQIITGPNMGGKSTFIRGIGSIIVMAQVGSFVPCASAEFSAVDCILARVGAGDAVQKGVSTFMAEMVW